jgi:hypothetical protein
MIDYIKKSNLIFMFGWVLLSAFLIFGTGVIGDDYSIPYFENSLHMTIAPLNYLVREPFYKFVESGNYLVIDLVKFFVLQATIFGCYKFFNLFHEKYFSTLLAFSFIYLPIHDGVTYWFTAQGYILCCALYFYAYYLLNNRNYVGAVFFAMLASFMGYGSPPFAIGIAYLAYRQFGFRASLLILIPNVLYVIYYLIVTKIFNVGIDRVSNGFDLLSLFKNILMQIVTAADALVGPSAWFKIYYSIMDLSLIPIGVVFVFWIFILRRIRFNDVSSETINKDLAGAFFVIMLASWVLFASTGFYPQISFNLGDRVTLWGALFTNYVILASAVKHRVSYIFVLAIVVLSAAGISQHWKNWHVVEERIIHNIRNNVDIKSLNKDAVVFVSGNGFSKLGPFSHLEFFAVESYASSIFKNALGRSYNLRVIYLGNNLSVDDGLIIRRGAEEIVKNEAYLNLYDSTENIINRVSMDQFRKILNANPKANRHWLQIYGCGSLNSLLEVIAPRYSYLCKS